MKVVKILGIGCSKCESTYALFEKIIADTGSDAELSKVTDLEEMMKYLVMSTPGVVIDEKLLYSGSIPKEAKIREWLGV